MALRRRIALMVIGTATLLTAICQPSGQLQPRPGSPDARMKEWEALRPRFERMRREQEEWQREHPTPMWQQ